MTYESPVEIKPGSDGGTVTLVFPYELTRAYLALERAGIRYEANTRLRRRLTIAVYDLERALQIIYPYVGPVEDDRDDVHYSRTLFDDGPDDLEVNSMAVFQVATVLGTVRDGLKTAFPVGEIVPQLVAALDRLDAMNALGFMAYSGSDGHGLYVGRWGSSLDVWAKLVLRVPEMITVQTHQGKVRETFDLERCSQLFASVRQQVLGPIPEAEGIRWYPRAHDLGIWAAALLAFWSEGDFRLEGNQIIRDLPAWPLQIITEPVSHTIGVTPYDIVSWVVADGRLLDQNRYIWLHLGVTGSYQRCRAFKAAVLNERTESLDLKKPGQYNGAWCQRMNGKGIYKTFWNAQLLPESGLVHMVLMHRSLGIAKAGQGFLLLCGNSPAARVDMQQFYQQLERSITFPIREAWAPKLWRYGRLMNVIPELTAYGCRAYWVMPSETVWAKIGIAIMRSERTGEKVDPTRLKTEELKITRYGPSQKPVEELVIKGQEEDPDAEED